MKSNLGSYVVTLALLTLGSCGGSTSNGDAATDTGTSADAGTSDGIDSGRSCPEMTRPAPCSSTSPMCIQDLRAARSRFPTCRTGYAYLPFVVACGIYDGVVAAGIDSATTYYFDKGDGHLVGVTNTGLTTLAPCEAFDPSFAPTICDAPADCPADAGSGA